MDYDLTGLNREILCIEYPGVVNSTDKMLETLGGVKEISKVISSHNRRLELRFRPDDIYCKPVCGDRSKTNSLLLRIKILVKKSKDGAIMNSVCKGSIQIIAKVKTSFKFRSLCDFQFLPMEVNEEGAAISLAADFLPHDLNGDSIVKWMERPIEYFLPPPAFARVDNLAQNSYMYRKGIKPESGPPSAVIGRTRKRRSRYAVFVSFNIKSTPVKPRERAFKIVHLKLLDKQYETLKKCFDERPIWSKLALLCVTKFTHEIIKSILPSLAYYFVTGPFRVMWVRFGYDPRQDPSSNIYQTLDYRMRTLAGLTNIIKAKRPYTHYILPNKSSHPARRSVVISKNVMEKADSVPETDTNLRGDEYLFTPTSLPSSRQMFYQYIDLKVPEIESMFERLPKNPTGKCDPRTGWLPRGFDNHCRDVITSYLKETLKKEKNIDNFEPLKSEEADDSSDGGNWQEESVTDEDIDNSEDE